MIKEILDNIDRVANEYKHLQIKIVWIPSHSEGNERADAEAKKAAKDPRIIEGLKQ
jgi:ribonuclease HI